MKQRTRSKAGQGLGLAVALCLLVEPAWAIGSTPVRVVNDESAPVPTRDVDHPANIPFSKLLCLTSIAGACDASSGRPPLPASFVVPAATSTGAMVHMLVIEFVSGTCIGTGRATFWELSSQPSGAAVNPSTGDNFSVNRFPLAVAQFLPAAGVNGVQAFAHPTRIYLEPGATVASSFDFTAAGQIACRGQLNGHFVAE